MPFTHVDQSTVIAEQLHRIDATAHAQNFDSAERADLARLAAQATQALRTRRPDE